jgi:signal transduction histidine kinase
MKFIDVRISAQYNTNGELTGTYGCNQDITEKRKKEDEIIRLNTELKELTNHLQRLRAEERNKLALEVHDKIGQRLVGMKFEIDYLKSHSKEPGTEIENKISHLSGEIAKMLKDFNAIYSEVNPTFIDDLNLFDAIDSLATEFGKKNNLIIRFYSNIEEEKFSHETKWNIYKILEECLHNIAEHSKAENVTIKVFKTNELLQIEVEDDGMGFDISKVNMSKQIGIIEMRERVSAAGGVMVFDSVQGRGTLIKITISNLRQP